MPVMHYRLLWPDDSVSTCYSPSLVIKDYFEAGSSYELPLFLHRLRTATQIASDRVAAKFGTGCSKASEQLAAIEAQALRYAGVPAARVRVLDFIE
jgi:uncharacterized repeat protein (TIGR04042 family)